MFIWTSKVVLRYFSPTSIIKGKKNPYMGIEKYYLQKMTQQYLLQSTTSIQHVNKLAMLGVACQQSLQKQTERLAKRCVEILDIIQNNINEESEQALKELQMANIFSIINQKNSIFKQKELEKVSFMYANTYSHIFPLIKHLEIYEISRKNPDLDLIASISSNNIQTIIDSYLPTLSEYITYLRLFQGRTTSEEINLKLSQYRDFPKLCELEETQKLTISYIMISKGGSLDIIEELQIFPSSLLIQQNQFQKWVCLKLQIMKFKRISYPSLDKINIEVWGFSSLIWLSQFCVDQQFSKKLRKSLLMKPLPSDLQPSIIFTYVSNSYVQNQQHTQISDWLCRQEISPKNEDSLCCMLRQIHENSWQPYYRQFFRKVLKLSLGSFKWQSQNIVYYYGEKQGIKDENMEYLRRYILNTYASLGTARRDIDTSSYFYKILEITNVQKFYGNL